MTLRLVLDTNMVLAWLVFDDPALHAMAAGLHAGRIVLLTHAPADEELQRVLAYDRLQIDTTRQREGLEVYRARTIVVPVAETSAPLPPGFPACRDRDDQHFLALAYHVKADALVTRDKAILKLRRRALKFGLRIAASVPLAPQGTSDQFPFCCDASTLPSLTSGTDP